MRFRKPAVLFKCLVCNPKHRATVPIPSVYKNLHFLKKLVAGKYFDPREMKWGTLPTFAVN
jgi:hypothetical protein